MQMWLRITLLAVCTAIGIAVALGVALNKPVPSPQKLPTVRAGIVAAPLRIEQPVLPPSAPAFSAAPVVAPYRDPVARQMGQLEDTLQELEESSHRRKRSMLRAIPAMQNRIDDPLPKPGP